MTEKPKRKFWQVHLSTAIFMMVIAGAAIGLNFLPIVEVITLGSGSESITLEQGLEYDRIERELGNNGLTCMRYRRYGWPRKVCNYCDFVRAHPDGWQRDDWGYGPPTGLEWASWDRDESYGKRGLVIGIAVFIALLTATAMLSEFIIRRRETEKP